MILRLILLLVPCTPLLAQQTPDITVDGSSTVAPLMLLAGQRFSEDHNTNVQVRISGTGGGLKRLFDRREDLRPDICGASRPILPSEIALAEQRGVAFVEVPIAYDGVAVVVHPSNRFCQDLTLEELRRIWAPGSPIRNWKDVRPGFPDQPLRLYGPGIESGTFDFFIDAVVGRASACRSDFVASEDDDVIARSVATTPGGLGYFGYSYYEAHKHHLNLVGVDAGQGPVRPSLAAIRAGRYEPLSRPLFMYVRVDALKRPELRAFVDHLLTSAPQLVESPQVSCVALSPALYRAGLVRLKARVQGSLAATADKPISLDKLYLRGRD